MAPFFLNEWILTRQAATTPGVRRGSA
jgi:hypothetical protein